MNANPSGAPHIKAAARQAAFIARKAAHAAAGDAPERAATLFLDAVAVAPGAVVSGYRPIRTEIDPTPLMRSLLTRGAVVCVPVIEGPGRPLGFRRWTPESRMVEGAFGAAIPLDGDWLTPDLLIAPLLAFDRRGMRLGYGGGFYDRTLALLRERGEPRAYGFAYAAQERPKVPTDSADQPLDGVITEQEAILIQ